MAERKYVFYRRRFTGLATSSYCVDIHEEGNEFSRSLSEKSIDMLAKALLEEERLRIDRSDMITTLPSKFIIRPANNYIDESFECQDILLFLRCYRENLKDPFERLSILTYL